MADIVALKEQVLGLVRMKGPVLPVQVSKEIESDTMFVGAIFSELIADKKLKITHAKVGGSPLYYVEGQEEKLNKLYDYLPGKEKEAYDLLKKNRVLVDVNQDAPIRVALRNLNDFAILIERDGNIFWRWYLINESEAGLLLDNLKIKPKKPKIEKQKELEVQKVKPKKIRVEKPDEFLDQIKSFLSSKDVKVLNEEIIRKNSDIEMRIRIPSNFGELDYFLKAKNKKRVSDNDLILAHHKGQKYKIPTLFLSSGDLTKKADKYISENLKGFLIFKKLE